ncbi:MAG: hypothetical protein AAF564_11315, partial [Bacteroidota bacterium]
PNQSGWGDDREVFELALHGGRHEFVEEVGVGRAGGFDATWLGERRETGGAQCGGVDAISYDQERSGVRHVDALGQPRSDRVFGLLEKELVEAENDALKSLRYAGRRYNASRAYVLRWSAMRTVPHVVPDSPHAAHNPAKMLVGF